MIRITAFCLSSADLRKILLKVDLIFIFNFTPMPHDNYLMGFPEGAPYSKLLDTDDTDFGGSGYNQQQQIETIP